MSDNEIVRNGLTHLNNIANNSISNHLVPIHILTPRNLHSPRPQHLQIHPIHLSTSLPHRLHNAVRPIIILQREQFLQTLQRLFIRQVTPSVLGASRQPYRLRCKSPLVTEAQLLNRKVRK